MTMTEYRQQRLAEQHPDVQGAAKDIRQTLDDIKNNMHWAIAPGEKDGGAYYCHNLLDYAHQLVDQVHAYRNAVKANPPPKGDDQ